MKFCNSDSTIETATEAANTFLLLGSFFFKLILLNLFSINLIKVIKIIKTLNRINEIAIPKIVSFKAVFIVSVLISSLLFDMFIN